MIETLNGRWGKQDDQWVVRVESDGVSPLALQVGAETDVVVTRSDGTSSTEKVLWESVSGDAAFGKPVRTGGGQAQVVESGRVLETDGAGSWSKLRSGEWGVRFNPEVTEFIDEDGLPTDPEKGDTIVIDVETRSGKRQDDVEALVVYVADTWALAEVKRS